MAVSFPDLVSPHEGLGMGQHRMTTNPLELFYIIMYIQLNNLKKINKGILDHYESVLHLSLGTFSHPDLTLIG